MNPFTHSLRKVDSEEARVLTPVGDDKEDAKVDASDTKPFDYNFDLHAAKEDPALRPIKVNQGEIDALVAAAEARGYERGLAEGRGNHEAQYRDGMLQQAQAVNQALEGAATQALLEINQTAGHAADLALEVGRTLAAHLIARHPEAEIMGLLEDSLEHLRTVPHIILRVSPDLCETLQPMLDNLAHKHNLSAPPMLMPDRDISWGNCQLDWANGSIMRNHDESLLLIEARIRQFVEDNAGPVSHATFLEEETLEERTTLVQR